MGFFRGTIVFLLALAFFLMAFVANLFLTLSWSLDYDNVNPSLSNLTSDFAKASGSRIAVFSEYETKKIQCSVLEEVNFSYAGAQIPVPCSVVETDANSVIDYLDEEVVRFYYYKDYSCNFLNCLETEKHTFFLFSQTAKEYWNLRFNSLLPLMLAVLVLMFVFVKSKHNALVLGGIMIIFSSFPFKQISLLFSIAPNFIPFELLPVFFSKSDSVFNLSIIIGLLMVVVGIGFGFFKLGMKLGNLFKKLFGKIKGKKEEVNEGEKKLISLKVKEEVEKVLKKKKR
ncbi:MAG: hypothetical protein KKB62_03840 [Nanoarchaeota archaeon]|nr:hypothetical protein [Nanoarchaeota archaeon]